MESSVYVLIAFAARDGLDKSCNDWKAEIDDIEISLHRSVETAQAAAQAHLDKAENYVPPPISEYADEVDEEHQSLEWVGEWYAANEFKHGYREYEIRLLSMAA